MPPPARADSSVTFILSRAATQSSSGPTLQTDSPPRALVTLNGYVNSYAKKVADERAAQRVSGVKAVTEEIKVRFESDAKTADHEIAKRILDVLKWNVLVPEKDIKVKVEHGWVTLTGNVEWHYQSQEARKAVGKISGMLMSDIPAFPTPTCGPNARSCPSPA
jgi:hypothetical protein